MFQMSLPKASSAFAVAAMLLSIAACARGTAPATPTQFHYAPATSHAHGPAFSSGHLYVANVLSQTVSVYPLASRSLARTISTPVGLDNTSLAFDSSGNLYVLSLGPTSSSSGAVRVYAAGSSRLLRTISSAGASAMAIDSSDNLYVGNYGATPYNGSVTVYAPGGTTVKRTITDGINAPFTMLCDAFGNLYVANFGGNTVSVYAPGATRMSRTIASGISAPVSLAFDSLGNLYVGNYSSVSVYAPGSTSMLRSITDGVGDPHYLALDSSNDLYVGNFRKTVTVYGPGSTSVLRTLSNDAVVSGLVLDAMNHPYVAWWRRHLGALRGSIKMYSSSGSTAILIIGRPQGVRGPTALAVGP